MSIYKCNDIYPTIQGEGCLTGVPMVILRLHGCGVGCPWCDTKETWVVDEVNRQERLENALGQNALWAEYSSSEIAAYIRIHYPAFRWVLVTGGEPADQDLQALTLALRDAGLKSALETSGTAIGLYPSQFDWVCVSPKIGMPGGRQVLAKAIAMADEIKYVVGKQSDIDKLDELLKTNPTKPSVTVCLQPLSLSAKATELCATTCMERGWRLSLQLHKFIGQR